MKVIFGHIKLFYTSVQNRVPEKNTNDKQQYLSEILSYLGSNYNSRITLGDLESKFKTNKYKLLRDFKKDIGISPLEYQTAIRIEACKKMFFEEIPIVHIGLETGFHDQSHFTHCFKKYVGVTPKTYKHQCNILQDL